MTGNTNPYSSSRIDPALLACSSVCTRWRQISLDTPQLWTTILLAQPPSRWVPEMLRRSKVSPLTIHCRSPTDVNNNFKNMITMLVNETGRFREAIIESSFVALSMFLPPKLALRAPLLENITLDVHSAHVDNVLHPPTMLERFWTELNSLRSLELFSILPITTTPMLSLTNLFIRTPYIGNHLSVPWLCELFQHTPQLEIIDIGEVSSNPPIVIMGTAPISLSRLRSLTISLKYMKESQLFSYMKIPNRIYSRIIFCNEDPPFGNNDDHSHLQSFIASRIPDDLFYLHVDVEMGDRSADYAYHLVLRHSDHGATIFLDLSIDNLPSPSPPLLSLLRSLPLEMLYKLELRGVLYNPLEFADFLQLLNNLRSLHVETVTLLRSITRDDQSSSNCQITSLSYCNPDLDEVIITRDYDSTSGDWSYFIRACKACHQHGRPLRKLTIEECNITQKDAKLLKTCTGLDWDGHCSNGSDSGLDDFEGLSSDE
ncbi:hypothetical protein ONZ45_g17288 [Pleurotus djamor]|nr:hypothetical protein ONZ45_g17288 [Pleurotus djamor]